MVQRFDLENVGCAERIWRQAEELARRGHEVDLVNFPHPERRRRLPRLRPEAPPGVNVVPLDRRGPALWGNTRTVGERVAQADVVHLWKAYPDTAIPVLCGIRRSNKPFHYDWDDLEGGRGGIAERLTRSCLVGHLIGFWEGEILNWVDTVSVASQEIGERCRKSGFPTDRTFLCPVGATLSELDDGLLSKWRDRLGEKKTILFMGQLEAQDFPLSVLSAVEAILEEDRDTLFAVVGDGTAREALENETRRLGISGQVLFAGYLPWGEAQCVLSLASVFIHPLHDDLMSRCKSPLVVVEAMARGVPVVASDVGEAPRMLGESGTLVRGLETEPWREALAGLLGDSDRRRGLARKAKQRFLTEWTWERAVDRLEEAYRVARANGGL